MELRQYQQSFNDSIIKSVFEHKKIIAQLATGGGKSICFSAIAHRFCEKFTDKAVLILVHRKELLNQGRRTMYKAFGLSAQPIVAGMKYIPPAQVYIGMIETVWNRIDKLQNIGLVIIDEAHINSFAKIHQHFTDAYFIGFSATPVSANKHKPLKRYYHNIVCGVSIQYLIEQGSLCQNITIAPEDTVERAKLTLKNGEFDDGLMALQFSQKRYINNTVQAYLKHSANTKAIIFNITIEHSQMVCLAFCENGLPARHLDGTMDAQTRTETLEWFSNTHNGILCNVGIATTGFDEPSIETVIVNKAIMSMPLWLQMCGRGARPTPAKAMFRIIDMGANGITHSDWSYDRDWETLFWNPPKAGDGGGGVAPVKDCPQCRCLIAAQCRTCPQCGYEYPAPEVEFDTDPLGDFIVITKGIDPAKLIEENKHKKEYYPFFEIGRQLAIQAKNTVPAMTTETADFIFVQYERLAKEWCSNVGKKYNKWHSDTAKAHLFEQLQGNFKKWKSPIQPLENKNIPPKVISYDIKPLPSIPFIQNLTTI